MPDNTFEVNINGTVLSWPNAFSEEDLTKWIFIGVSFAKIGDSHTKICVHIKNTRPIKQCKEANAFYRTNEEHFSVEQYKVIVLGEGFIGLYKTFYVWSYAKALNSMAMFAPDTDDCAPPPNAFAA